MSLILDEEEAIKDMLVFGLTPREIADHTSIDIRKVKSFLAKREEDKRDGCDRRRPRK